MKQFFVCLLFFAVSIMQAQEYIIAELALKEYSNFDAYRLLVKPNNSQLSNFTGHILNEPTLNLPKAQFNLEKDTIQKWRLKDSKWDKATISKSIMIKDFDSLPKKPLKEQAYIYIELSNVAFSEDKQHALVVVNKITNSVISESEIVLMYFEKIKGKWRLVTKEGIGVS